MCSCLLKLLKCPARIVCCCFNCALNVLLSCICSALMLIAIIGLIYYFIFYKDKPNTDEVQKMTQKLMQNVAPHDFRDFFGTIE